MTNLIAGLLVIVLGVLAGWYFIGNRPPVNPTNPQTDVSVTPASEASGSGDSVPTPTMDSGLPSVATPQGTTKGGTGGTPSTVTTSRTVTYRDTGFTPQSVTVRLGTAVTFTSSATGSMWVASAPHPTHDALPGFDQKAGTGSGGDYTYTFTKVGTWKYHNHLKPEHTGVVIVTQ
ncbi:hypothetical protein A2Z33_06715 [Candidatus Gottesmanbacteria bacterium RBG_16_52_11]|uniref:EfeO-type cupredoxin-like domain-containing protein n=1 Tax=Candidatus Gottesmanbacteria bacterium RBG_16_52_11 TaxID=1798374 RepID=A0A1F5YXU4_9BACT|nr:MAG: hypothetical protein A2Z33_06715 [Candidatus Gottesmanbacteria bacterium RBG_16_52_11]